MNRKPRALFIALSISLAMAALVVGVVLAATNVDTFDEGTGTNVQLACEGGICTFLGLPKSSVASPGGGVAIGIERDLIVTRTTGTSGVFLTVDDGDNNQASLSIDNATQGIAQIAWDGADGDATVLNATGLGGININPDDGVRVAVISADHLGNLTIKAYTDGSNYSFQTKPLPANITGRTDFFFRFADFTPVGTGFNPASLGAIVLEIDGTVEDSLDMSIDFVETESVRDFGDIPATYPAADRLASHIPAGVRLGSLVDTESAHQPDASANGDNSATVNDEDGVFRTPGVNWAVGAGGGSINVTVNGCPGTCYFNGWVDWGSGTSASFADAGDQIFNDRPVTNGANQTLTFAVPAGVNFATDPPFFARFRICSAQNACNTTTATNVQNGEIEDYLWGFGPTAVSLESVRVNGSPSLSPLMVGSLVVLSLMSMGLYLQQRNRQLKGAITKRAE